jgi:hypothetical protein
MRLYMRAGRREAALRQYQNCLTALAAEVGMPPDPETRRLHEQILHWRPSRSDRERGPEADPASTVPAPDIVSLASRALPEPPTSTDVPPAISELIGRSTSCGRAAASRTDRSRSPRSRSAGGGPARPGRRSR